MSEIKLSLFLITILSSSEYIKKWGRNRHGRPTSLYDNSCIYVPHPVLSVSKALLHLILATLGFRYPVLPVRKAKALIGLDSLASKEPAMQSSLWVRNTDSVYQGERKARVNGMEPSTVYCVPDRGGTIKQQCLHLEAYLHASLRT